jgi:ABC-type multidrug transport system ATPase subunit
VSEPASEPAAPALRAAGLSLAYGGRWVLRDLALELAAGATLAVLGPNGAGKSTLLRIVATLLRPTAGSIEVLGAALPKEAWRLRGRIGFLGHQPLLYRDLDARENLAFHGRLFGLPDGGAARAGELLERVGLAARARTRVDEMSAGMVRRLAVCRTLLHEPDLLVLDEPLANLDPAAATAVAPLLGPAPGRTRIVVSHDVEAALADADRVLGLERDGTVAFESAAAEVDPDRARAIYSERAGMAA